MEKQLTDVLSHEDVSIVEDLEKGLSSDDPKHFTKVKKYFILVLISIAGVLAPLASTIYFPSIESIIKELKTTSALLDITISVFMLVLGIFPLFWGGLADRYSRKWVLIIALILFILSNVGAALSHNVGILIAMRFIQGVGSSASFVVGIGVIIDIFPKSELGSAMSFFLVGTLAGPISGPILGGILDELLGWRLTFWFLAIVGGFILALIVIFLPETLPESSKQPLPYKLVKFKLIKNGPKFNPLFPLVFLKYPVVILATIVGSIAFSAFFAVESFHSRAMDHIYELRPLIVGLTFIIIAVGSILGNLVGGKLSDFMYQRYSKISPTNHEIRLKGAWVCSLVLVTGLLMYGWFLEFKLHLAMTLFAFFLIGFGYSASSIGVYTYLVDLVPQSASSITAASNVFKMVLSSIVTAVNTLVLDNLGFGWGGTLYALLSFIIVIILLLLVKHGHSIRNLSGPEPNAHS